MKASVKVFIWDWKEQPPLVSIIHFTRKNPDLKVFDIDNGADEYEIAFAKNQREIDQFLLERAKRRGYESGDYDIATKI